MSGNPQCNAFGKPATYDPALFYPLRLLGSSKKKGSWVMEFHPMPSKTCSNPETCLGCVFEQDSSKRIKPSRPSLPHLIPPKYSTWDFNWGKSCASQKYGYLDGKVIGSKRQKIIQAAEVSASNLPWTQHHHHPHPAP